MSTEYSYNSIGAINISLVRNNTEMGDVLEAMKAELVYARDAGAIPTDVEAQARLFLTQAAREVRMPVPSKPTLIDHLDDARACLAEAGILPELQSDLANAVDVAHALT